jgi:hypothetical protein
MFTITTEPTNYDKTTTTWSAVAGLSPSSATGQSVTIEGTGIGDNKKVDVSLDGKTTYFYINVKGEGVTSITVYRVDIAGMYIDESHDISGMISVRFKAEIITDDGSNPDIAWTISETMGGVWGLYMEYPSTNHVLVKAKYPTQVSTGSFTVTATAGTRSSSYKINFTK